MTRLLSLIKTDKFSHDMSYCTIHYKSFIWLFIFFTLRYNIYTIKPFYIYFYVYKNLIYYTIHLEKKKSKQTLNTYYIIIIGEIFQNQNKKTKYLYKKKRKKKTLIRFIVIFCFFFLFSHSSIQFCHFNSLIMNFDKVTLCLACHHCPSTHQTVMLNK